MNYINKKFLRNSALIYNQICHLKNKSSKFYGKEFNDILNIIEIPDDKNNKIEYSYLYEKFHDLDINGNFILFTLKYDNIIINENKQIDNSALITALDVVSTVGVSAFDKTFSFRHNVSSKLSIKYLSPVKDKLLILTCSGINITNDRAICTTDVYNLDKDLLTSCQHVKGFLKNTWNISNLLI